MSEPRKEWNLPLTYLREGIFLYHLLRFMPLRVGPPYRLEKSRKPSEARAGGSHGARALSC
jgi:hypothetical protein